MTAVRLLSKGEDAMGELSEDLCRCLEGAQCDSALAARATCACEEGRLREAKRVLLSQRQQLLDDVHSKQRSIDEIDHVLHRMSGGQGGRR